MQVFRRVSDEIKEWISVSSIKVRAIKPRCWWDQARYPEVGAGFLFINIIYFDYIYIKLFHLLSRNLHHLSAKR